jgi:hypothetical protein
MKLLENEDVDVHTFHHEQHKWSPSKFHDDAMVNAVLNVAAQLSVLASATNRLLYGLKYGKNEGLSVAERWTPHRRAWQPGWSRWPSASPIATCEFVAHRQETRLDELWCRRPLATAAVHAADAPNHALVATVESDSQCRTRE